MLGVSTVVFIDVGGVWEGETSVLIDVTRLDVEFEKRRREEKRREEKMGEVDIFLTERALF